MKKLILIHNKVDTIQKVQTIKDDNATDLSSSNMGMLEMGVLGWMSLLGFSYLTLYFDLMV